MTDGSYDPGVRSPNRTLSPISPTIELLSGISKDKSEMERLLALAEERRSQQRSAADEQRRMSLDQKEEATRKQREKAVRALVTERRHREELERQKKWHELEEERLRQMREEEAEEARVRKGVIDAVRNSQENLAEIGTNDDEDGDGEEDAEELAALQAIEDEPIWGILPAPRKPEEDVENCESADDTAASEMNGFAGMHEEKPPNTGGSYMPEIEESTDGTGEVGSLDENAASADSTPATKKRERLLSDSTIDTILDPLASAIENITVTKSEKRRSITAWSPSALSMPSQSSRRASRNLSTRESESSIASSSPAGSQPQPIDEGPANMARFFPSAPLPPEPTSPGDDDMSGYQTIPEAGR